MSDKEFEEVKEQLRRIQKSISDSSPPDFRPRPGAGAYPASPVDFERKPAKVTPKGRGRPQTRRQREKEIENDLAKYNVNTRSLGDLINRLAQSRGLSPGYLDRHFKKFIRKTIARMKEATKNN